MEQKMKTHTQQDKLLNIAILLKPAEIHIQHVMGSKLKLILHNIFFTSAPSHLLIKSTMPYKWALYG